MCKVNLVKVELVHEINVVNIVCSGCKGSGVTIMNDFSDEYQVTQFEDDCMMCGGDGRVDVIEKVITKCECGKLEDIPNLIYANQLSDDEKEHIKEHGFMNDLCADCFNQYQRHAEEEYYASYGVDMD